MESVALDELEFGQRIRQKPKRSLQSISDNILNKKLSFSLEVAFIQGTRTTCSSRLDVKGPPRNQDDGFMQEDQGSV